ncbi:hypothetical protein B0H13DRAFT_1897135 [Mycena leptocephala]|nr:hypothetical protein B0H13DRAFT_1897135 [Mycena leptocephala]
MDGKTITHKICAVSTCQNELVNYKNGRFCLDHLDMREICGIIPFSRMSFPGVQRVIRRQLGDQPRFAAPNETGQDRPNLHPELPSLDGVPGLEDPNSAWLTTTKFIVDAWHYIGRRGTDVLCRLWCNPAPTNGSQPDLVLVNVDDNGRTHTTRAFNTETAEQLNAWLNGFEAQLRQMSATITTFNLSEKSVKSARLRWKQAKIPADDGGISVELRWHPQDDGGILLKSSLNLPESGGNRPRFRRTTVEILVELRWRPGDDGGILRKSRLNLPNSGRRRCTQATDPAEAARHRTKIHRFPPGG